MSGVLLERGPDPMVLSRGWEAADWPGNDRMNPGCECHVAVFRPREAWGYSRGVKVYIHREPEGWAEVSPGVLAPTGYRDAWGYAVEGVLSGLCERASTLDEAKRYVEARAERGLLLVGKRLYREG